MSFSSWGSQPPEPKPLYEYRILRIWFPSHFSSEPLNVDAKNGWRVIDIHWSGEKNEEDQELVTYHLERANNDQKPKKYTIEEVTK